MVILSGARCADLHVAQLMPLPLAVSCFSKIQIGLTFLVPAYPSIKSRKRTVKWVCVCVCVCVCKSTIDIDIEGGRARCVRGPCPLSRCCARVCRDPPSVTRCVL